MNNINFNNFEEAGQAILKFLSQRFGFKLWMITRTEGDDWIGLCCTNLSVKAFSAI